MTTLFASTAGTTARYYADYLANDCHELPGHWSGAQAPGLGLAGEVTPDQLEALLSGLDPHTGSPLGRPLLDRVDQKGNVIKAVAGYDATFSAPKSVSVLWALTGDDGVAECHDRAVTAAVDLIEKYGSTTRIRSNGTRLHQDTGGLTIGVFRQSTSRADDPQLHTHVVISSKVQTTDGRWYALDGRVLKRHQQAFGYAYQSALDTLHRFTRHWEADASLLLRAGDPRVLDTYLRHDRIRAGTIDEHLDAIAAVWLRCRAAGESVSITTSRNEHVAAINQHIQTVRAAAGHLDPTTAVHISGGVALVDDVVATRLNDRRLRTTASDGIRNRERWTVTHTHRGGAITVSGANGHGSITLPADYVREHVELAYATTEHGAQGHTADRSITLTTPATTGRNLYVGMSRGRTSNHALVVTETPELSEAISILEAAMVIDRADIPAVAHRRALAATRVPAVPPRVEAPAWFDTVRANAAQARTVAQQALDERDTARADRQRRVAAAGRDLPAAQSAHAPFRDDVAAAKQTNDEAQRDLWRAEGELREAGRLHRRSAQRAVDAASDHLAAAEHRLDEATARAEPTRSHLEHLTRIISHARERQSSERILDQWNDLEGDATRAADLCDALDRWKRWADGHEISRNELADAAAVLADNSRTPGIAELADVLIEREHIELPRLEHPSPSREIGLGLEL